MAQMDLILNVKYRTPDILHGNTTDFNSEAFKKWLKKPNKTEPFVLYI